MSLTSPLGLMRHVHKPDLRLAVVPWVNVVLIAWMFSLLQSSYIYAPGMSVALTPGDRAAMENIPATADLPSIPASSVAGTPGNGLPGRRVDATLSIHPPLFTLDNSIHSLDSDQNHELADALKESVRKLHLLHSEKPVLLILAPGSLDLKTFMKVCTLANAAGFEIAQLAATPDDAFLPTGDASVAAAPGGAGTKAP